MISRPGLSEDVEVVLEVNGEALAQEPAVEARLYRRAACILTFVEPLGYENALTFLSKAIELAE